MKKVLAMFVCISVLLCGGLLLPTMASKSTKEAKVKTSKTTKEANQKKAVQTKKKKGSKFTTDKNLVRQNKILKEVAKDATIKQDPKIKPGLSPEDQHPSNQF